MVEAAVTPTTASLTSTDPASSSSKLVKSFGVIMHYVAEIIVLLLVFSSFASLQKGALKVEFQPPPVPFFGSNSSVDDFYSGDISVPFTTVMETDVSLIMYYAPWDFDSQMARTELEQVARQFQDQVYFAAINCWYLHGQCHQHFPKIRSFPLLLVYVAGQKGIQYRGPLRHSYIHKFLSSVLRPLERINQVGDLYQLLAKSSAVVTGYFNFSDPNPVGFKSFYLAASRYLEYDVHRTVTFAAVTNPKSAALLGIDPNRVNKYDIRLHLWNETLIYLHNSSTSLDLDRFLPWIYHRTHNPVQWLSPPGRKSRLVQESLLEQPQASLVLFAPRLSSESSQMLVKEIALEYNNCFSSPRVSRLIQEIKNQREALEIARSELENKCSIFMTSKRKNWCLCSQNSSFCQWDRSLPPTGEEQECRLLFWKDHEVQLNEPLKSAVHGIKCRTNHSLSFFAMDSELYPDFASRLGYSYVSPTAAFIIEPQDESHFALNGPLFKENLEQFVLNFTSRELQRLRRSRRKTDANVHCGSEGYICIREISGSQFEEVVLHPSADVLVFYRKSNCIFSDVSARKFLKTALLFQRRISQSINAQRTASHHSALQLDFVFIDGEENDLPWPFTVDRYPTVVFYPATRKTESRVFPADTELTVGNLLNFIFRQVHLKKRVSWFAHLCRDEACWNEAQRRIGFQMAIIELHLRILQSHLLRTEQYQHGQLWKQWRQLDEERRFYRELNLTVLESIALFHEKRRQEKHNNRYPDGIRFTED